MENDITFGLGLGADDYLTKPFRIAELRKDNTPVPLTRSDYLICEYLARNKRQVFSKEQIYEAVFSLEGDSDNSTISTHIKNIRAKLSKLDIQPKTTVWEIGYKWE